jgi:hypothetical protein
MRKFKAIYRLSAIAVIAITFAGCATSKEPTIQTGPDAEVSFDGLHVVDNSNANKAWARPDFDISTYTKIMMRGAGIEYRPVKNRGSSSIARSQGGPYFIDDKSRADFESLVGEIFDEEMSKIANFTVVDEAGPDVLEVRGGLLDVVSYVPPDAVGGRSYVVLRNIGEATLVLELIDSESGAVLARSVDRRAAENYSGTMQRSNSVSNSAEVKRLIRFWAERLRDALDGFSGQT